MGDNYKNKCPMFLVLFWNLIIIYINIYYISSLGLHGHWPVASDSLLSHSPPEPAGLIPGNQHTAVFVEGLLADVWGWGSLGTGDVYLSRRFTFYVTLLQDSYDGYPNCLSYKNKYCLTFVIKFSTPLFALNIL